MKNIQRIGLWMAMAIAGFILAAWLFPGIRPMYPDNWDLMKANTAVCVLVSAILISIDRPLNKFPHQVILLFISFLVTGTALFTHLTGIYISSVNDLLIVQYPTPSSGLMSLQTAIFFIVFSIFILLQKTRLSVHSSIPSIGGVIVLSYAFMLASGYLFGAVTLIGQSNEIRTPPQTLIAMILLVISYIIWTLPRSLFSILVSNSDSGKTVRDLLPWAVLIPYIILLLGYTAYELSVLSPSIAAALVGTITSAAIGLLIILFGYNINSLHDQLSKQALLDPLTGCYNQRGFFELGVKYGKDRHRHEVQVGVIYFDLDKLKETNDTYGHVMGSQLIVTFVRLIKENIREGDILGRLGGDEFGLLVEEASIYPLLDRIESAANEFNRSNDQPYSVLFSWGVSVGEVWDMESLEQLVNQSDQLMYENKMSKR